jgi:hypothetical protein
MNTLMSFIKTLLVLFLMVQFTRFFLYRTMIGRSILVMLGIVKSLLKLTREFAKFNYRTLVSINKYIQSKSKPQQNKKQPSRVKKVAAGSENVIDFTARKAKKSTTKERG